MLKKIIIFLIIVVVLFIIYSYFNVYENFNNSEKKFIINRVRKFIDYNIADISDNDINNISSRADLKKLINERKTRINEILSVFIDDLKQYGKKNDYNDIIKKLYQYNFQTLTIDDIYSDSNLLKWFNSIFPNGSKKIRSEITKDKIKETNNIIQSGGKELNKNIIKKLKIYSYNNDTPPIIQEISL